MADNRNQYEGEVRNIAKQSSEGRVQSGEHSGYVTPIKFEDENVAKKQSDGQAGSVTFDLNSEYVILADHEDAVLDVERNRVADFTDDVIFVQFRDNDGVIKSSAELNNEANVAGSSVHIKEHETVADFPFLMNAERDFSDSAVKDDQVAQPPVRVKNKVFALPEKDDFLDHTVNIHPSVGYSSEGPNRNVDALQAEVTHKTYDWEENNMEIIKSTVKLLQAQFNDVLSHDAESVLPSSVALVAEIEQSLFHLQDSISQCEVQRSDFCAQLQERMKVSVVKLKEMTERLVDDIDEQLYKLLSRITRKLKKFKRNLQDKWCHLAHQHDSKNDAIYGWLHSSLLLECKESQRQTKRKFREFSSEEPSKLSEMFVMGTSDEKVKGMDEPNIFKIQNMEEECNGIKNGDSNTASEEGQRSGIQYTVTQTEYVMQSHINKELAPDKVIMIHDNLNEEHFKMNTVPKAFEKSNGEEQYMSELHKNWKHDNQGTFKNHFNEEEKNKPENKDKNVPLAKTCWQTHNGKTVCKKFKNNQQFLRSQKFKEQHVTQSLRDNHSHEKKNLKSQFNDKDKKAPKKLQTKRRWQDENKHHKQSLILEQGASWVMVDTSIPKQSNISGDWVLKMADSRAEHRRLEHKSDWLFDRADARKLKREKQHITGNWYFERARGRVDCHFHPHSKWCKTGTYSGPDFNWYFERARGRAYCRFHPHSSWCKTGTSSGPNFDGLHQSDYENDYSYSDRSHRAAHWSKKFKLHLSAAAGKFFKRSFSHFQNKMNYHNHH
ncbi:hypothetical protein B7P43_G07975 [Cryptotermes secundus]|nr:hypothetical protein B7P43_G07975 [Cryptotermes secundus]